MKCIPKDEVFENETIIKKSRFIASLKYVSSEEEAQNFIKSIKSVHVNATHNCSAFICGDIVRRDDDGEPGGTAGQPMLEVLNKNDINNICVVVTRYFGGIKLGAGGLIRAYAKSVSTALDNIDLINLTPGYTVSIKFDYTDVKIIDHFFLNNNIDAYDKKFEQKVIYKFNIAQDKYDEIEKAILNINHTISLDIIDKIYVVLGE